MFDQVPFAVTVWKVVHSDPMDLELVYSNVRADAESGLPLKKLWGRVMTTLIPNVKTAPKGNNPLRAALKVAKDGYPRVVHDLPFTGGGLDRIYNMNFSRVDVDTVLCVYDTDTIDVNVAHMREVERKLLMLENLDGYAIYTKYDGTVVDVNRLHPDYPLDVDEFIGTNIFESSTDEANANMREAFKKVTDGCREEYEYLTPGSPEGHWYQINIKKATLPDLGDVLLWVSWDITDLKVAQDKIRNAKEDLEQFAYIVSHDLQEPIRTIAAYVDILLDDYAELFEDEEPKEFMEYVRDSALRQQRLIQDILIYSRTSNMTFEECDIYKCYDTVQRSLASLIDRKRADIEWVGDTDVWEWAAPSYVEMALQNLISNAIKYVPEGRNPRVKVWATKEAPYTIVHVQDNGIGIEPRYVDMVFRMFKRLHTNEVKYEGSGIGLPVCKRIARQHGGDCWFDSEPGKGSTFHISFRHPLNIP
jgi:signal transduction histidine kinase